jgi:hypothetical protein
MFLYTQQTRTLTHSHLWQVLRGFDEECRGQINENLAKRDVKVRRECMCVCGLVRIPLYAQLGYAHPLAGAFNKKLTQAYKQGSNKQHCCCLTQQRFCSV